MVLAQVGRADGLDQDGQYLAVLVDLQAVQDSESWDQTPDIPEAKVVLDVVAVD